MVCHLVRTPGDRKVACGFLASAVPVGWARSMGAHELGRAFAGRPLPEWCPACILALAAGQGVSRRVP